MNVQWLIRRDRESGEERGEASHYFRGKKERNKVVDGAAHGEGFY